MTELFTFQMNQTKENHDINNYSIRCNHDVNSNNFVVIEIYSMAKFAKKLKDNEGQVKREWQQFIEWVKRK